MLLLGAANNKRSRLIPSSCLSICQSVREPSLPRYVGFIVRTVVIRGGLRQNANRRRVWRPLQQKLQERTTRQFHVYKLISRTNITFSLHFCRRFEDFFQRNRLDSIIKKGKTLENFIFFTQSPNYRCSKTFFFDEKSARFTKKLRAVVSMYSRNELSS